MAGSIKKKLCILGLSATAIASSVALSGCSKRDLMIAQQNIDESAVKLLNSDAISNGDKTNFRYFTFLGADVESNENLCNVDINGIAVTGSRQKSYTTFNYVVDKSYFPTLDDASKYDSSAKMVNSLADIIKNEQLASYSIVGIDSAKDLNTTLAKITDSGLNSDYKCQGNFLYSVNNLSFNENENYASFSTKEMIKFAKSNVNYWAFTENGPIYTIDADRQILYVNQDVFVKLTPEEMERAKTDSSFVFSKLAEYVANNNTASYATVQTSVTNEKEQGIVMNEEVSLSNM